jgi:hypothetical protein
MAKVLDATASARRTAQESVSDLFSATPSRRCAFARVRPTHEWHLVFAKTYDHLTFDLSPWPGEAVVVFRPSFHHAWLKAVWAIRDAVLRNRIQQLLVELLPVQSSKVAVVSDQGRSRCAIPAAISVAFAGAAFRFGTLSAPGEAQPLGEFAQRRPRVPAAQPGRDRSRHVGAVPLCERQGHELQTPCLPNGESKLSRLMQPQKGLGEPS